MQGAPSWIQALICVSVPVSSPLQSGDLQLFSIASGSLLECVKAHDGAVWSVSLSPDRRGFVTGSADHQVKFWEFELVSEEEEEEGRGR